MRRRGHTLRRRYGCTQGEHPTLISGQRVYVPYADEVDEGIVIERGDGGFNMKRAPDDPYVVRIVKGVDVGLEGAFARARLFEDPLAASIESARLHEEAMRD